MNYDLAIIGGGAAGMAAAVFASENGVRTVVIEHNRQLGKKLAITGKGRCNVTINSDNDNIMKNIPTGSRFLYSALAGFSAYDTMNFFEGLGVPLKTERGNRVFPDGRRNVGDEQLPRPDIVWPYRGHCEYGYRQPGGY